MPDWLRTVPMHARSATHDDGEIRTVKQCSPFIDAMGLGFTIPLPCDLCFRDGVFTWA
jgi:hypothetical protein